ncbi:ABC transporter permease [Rubrivirga sp.]|uniref:ABC transporter permease n=1 Tax=Rubrivirga sp. TaxID=1885344 RepID=UPI003C76EDB6
MNAVDISVGQLVLASGLLLVAIGLSVALRLGLTKGLAVAATRMVIQLTLVGLVLEWVFSSENAVVIVALAVGMALLAGHAAVRRTSRRFPGIWLDALVSVLGASFIVTGAAVLGILRIEPWFDPQYLIPLHGMLLGNALTGISLSLDRFMEGASSGRATVDARLALGATRWEAARPLFREAVRTGLVPITNSMAVMGVVSLPGMMTGQILAGAPPAEAVRYQILIVFMIAACVALASLGVVGLAYRRLFTPDHRFHPGHLRDA